MTTPETPSDTPRLPEKARPWLHAATAGAAGILIAFIAPQLVIGSLFSGPVTLLIFAVVLVVGGAALFGGAGALYRGRSGWMQAWTILPFGLALGVAYVTSLQDSGGSYTPAPYLSVLLAAFVVPALCALVSWRGPARIVGGVGLLLAAAGGIAYGAVVATAGPVLHVSNGTAQDVGEVRPYLSSEPGFHLSTSAPPTSYDIGRIATAYEWDVQPEPPNYGPNAFTLEVAIKLDPAYDLGDYNGFEECGEPFSCETIDGVTRRTFPGGYDLTRTLDDGSLLRIRVEDLSGAGTDTLIPEDLARRILEGAAPMDDEQFADFLFPHQKGCVAELGVCIDNTGYVGGSP